MRTRAVLITIWICAFIVLVPNILAQEHENDDRSQTLLEQRIERLEQEVQELGLRIELLLDSFGERIGDTGVQQGPNLTAVSADDADPVNIRIIGISFHESNSSNNWANDYREWIALVFEVNNNLSRDVRAIRGTVDFYDIFDEQWWSLGVTINDPIPAESTIEWNGRFTYNSFNAQHRLARNANAKDTYVDLRDAQVIMADGERLSL